MLPDSRGPYHSIFARISSNYFFHRVDPNTFCFTAKNVDIRSYFQQAIFHFVCLSQILKKLRNDTKTLNSSAIADRS